MWYIDVSISLEMGIDPVLELSAELVEFLKEQGITLESTGAGFGCRDLRFEVETQKEASEVGQAARKFLDERLGEDDFEVTYYNAILEMETSLRCPDCGRGDDFTLMGKGTFTIRRREGRPEKLALGGKYEMERCKCNVCEYTGSYALFIPD